MHWQKTGSYSYAGRQGIPPFAERSQRRFPSVILAETEYPIGAVLLSPNTCSESRCVTRILSKAGNPVDIFVVAALPRALRITEVDVHFRGNGELFCLASSSPRSTLASASEMLAV